MNAKRPAEMRRIAEAEPMGDVADGFGTVYFGKGGTGTVQPLARNEIMDAALRLEYRKHPRPRYANGLAQIGDRNLAVPESTVDFFDRALQQQLVCRQPRLFARTHLCQRNCSKFKKHPAQSRRHHDVEPGQRASRLFGMGKQHLSSGGGYDEAMHVMQ